jgi:hypothetical protein
MLSSATILRVAPGVASAPVDDEVTVLDPRTSVYFGLEGVGARIWSLIDGRTSVAGITAALRAEYDVTEDECLADVLSFADELVERGLLQVVGGPRDAR